MVSVAEERKPGGRAGLRIGLGVLGAGMAVVVGQALGGQLLGLLGLPAPPLPEGTDVAGLARMLPLAAGVLALGLAPLAVGLRAPAWLRFAVLTALVYGVWGVAMALEARLFVARGAGSAGYLVYGLASPVLPSLGAGAALAVLGHAGPLPARRHLAPAAWLGRSAALLVLFPLAYVGFGWLAYQFVGVVYREGAFGLTEPGWAQLLPTLGARSVLLALVVGPVVRLWDQDAGRLPVALGLGLFVLLGGYHGVLGYWLPAGLRLVHGLEILAGALFYASAAAVLLCVPPSRRTAVAA